MPQTSTILNKHYYGKTVLIVVAAWVVVAHHHATVTTVAPFCSAWIVQPILHHHPRHQHQHRLYSASPATKNDVSVDPVKEEYRELYPRSTAHTNGTLQTDDDDGIVHTLYYEIHGTGPLNALFLHGGPGAGCFPNHARFFDPTKYTVVLLDQRGAGKSEPRGCVENNTLRHLVEDCERLRIHLNIISSRSSSSSSSSSTSDAACWDVVLGGSWGATLGLAYAQRYPSKVNSLILRGICALRPLEVDWLFSANGGSALKLSEAWKNFSDAVNVNVNGDGDGDDSQDDGREALHAYYDCLISNTKTDANGTVDNSLRLAAARSWMSWEMAASSSAAQNSQNESANDTTTNDLASNVVLVSSTEHDDMNWRFENQNGEQVYDIMDNQSPETVASQLRQGIKDDNESEMLQRESSHRPVRPIDESMPVFAASADSTAGRFRLPPDYVPAQAMLTCYYSVNDRFVMGNSNLLDNNNNDDDDDDDENSNPPIRIIGIQGGQDPICPPDTAMDLLKSIKKSKSNMELRIPLTSGHSMYDPAIMHELIQATNRMADEFLGTN